MRLIFDASAQTFDQWWQVVFPLAALLLTVIAFARDARPFWKWTCAGFTVLVALLTVALPYADFQHVQAAIHSEAVRTVEGPISGHKRETIRRFMGTSRGVGVTSTSRYSETTIEQFFVGQQWFWFRVGGYASPASFTNAVDPPLPLSDGTIARISWFDDPWYNKEPRILRLELGTARVYHAGASSPGAAVATVKDIPPDFRAFWQRFSSAAARGDKAGVAALTRFPFLFAGTPLDRDRFDTIWAGIFPEPLRPCFASEAPVRDGDAWSLSCGVYVYVFEQEAGQWRLTGFTADPEAGQ